MPLPIFLIAQLLPIILFAGLSSIPLYAAEPVFFPPQPDEEFHTLLAIPQHPQSQPRAHPFPNEKGRWVFHQENHLPLTIELLPAGPSSDMAHSREAIQRLSPPEAPTSHLSSLNDYNYGIALWNEGHSDLALLEWEAAIRKDPYFAEAHDALGQAHLAQGQTRKAVQEFEAAIAIRPNWWAGHAHLGLAAYLLGEIDRAETELQQAVFLNPALASAHVNLGIIHFLKDDRPSALSHFHRALDYHPPLPEAHFNLAVVFASRGNWLEALEQGRHAWELLPGLPQLPPLLALIYQARGDWTRSLRFWREALLHDPTSATLHEHLAMALFHIGNWAEAVSEFDRSLALYPHNAQAYLHLGVAQQAQGHRMAAITAFRKAGKLEPTWAQPLLNWGKAIPDQPQAALVLFRQAIHRDADCAEAYYQMGLTHALLGQEQDMVSAFHEAANRGLVSAQTDLGTAYFTGSGVTRQIAEAMHWWFKAAEHGSPDARQYLSNQRRLVFNRKGTPQEVDETIRGFARLREEWNQRHQAHDETNRNVLAHLLQQAWLLDDHAAGELERIYREGLPPQIDPFDPRILEYFQRTAEEGRHRSCHFLQILSRQGEGVHADLLVAQPWKHCD